MEKSDTYIIPIQIFLGVLMLMIFLWVKVPREMPMPEIIWETSTGSVESTPELAATTYTWEWKQFPIVQECPENFMINTLSTSLNPDCLVSSVPLAQKYQGLKIIGIDATFATDGIDLVDAKSYFSNEWATFYGTRSPWVAPDRWVLRINSDYLFADQKVFYIFYNDNNNIPSYKREQIVGDLSSMFRHLNDIRLHSFSDYRRDTNGRPQDSEIGKLFYYIWDCQYLVHGWCDAKLSTTGKYKFFSDAMISDDIYILFVVPSTMVKRKILQWMFKSTNFE